MASVLTRRCARQVFPIAKGSLSVKHPPPSIPIRYASTATAAATTPPPSAPAPTTGPPKPAYTKPAYTPPSTQGSTSNAAPSAASAFKDGLKDTPQTDLPLEEGGIDWARSFSGLSEQAFSKDITEILLAPLRLTDIEIKPGTFPNHNAH